MGSCPDTDIDPIYLQTWLRSCGYKDKPLSSFSLNPTSPLPTAFYIIACHSSNTVLHIPRTVEIPMSARANAPLKSKLFKICLLAPPNCSSTHRAWFKVCVQTTACQFKCSQVFPCISYGHNFSMCTWITINKDSVVAFTWKKKSTC